MFNALAKSVAFNSKNIKLRCYSQKQSQNRFDSLVKSTLINGEEYRVLLESCVRNCDNFKVPESDVETILNWKDSLKHDCEIQFKPARVILQDFTGVPAIVDLAAMRDATEKLGGDLQLINPSVPVDLVVDHSIQVDEFGDSRSININEQLEMHRNKERFSFLKWGSKVFKNFDITPPGTGIVHQVNLECLARIVFNRNNLLSFDSVVGTDSHTPMINGLGVVGWGVGGIEAEAVMLGQPISMTLPRVLGFKLTGKLHSHVTSTDLVLTITKILRKKGVVNQFIEFYGPGVGRLTASDRATISNMSPETGATVLFFPVDDMTIRYLKLTNRDPKCISYIGAYFKAMEMYKDYENLNEDDSIYSEVIELNLNSIVPSVAGPKRPHDHIPLENVKDDFNNCLNNQKNDFKGFGLSPSSIEKTAKFTYKNQEYTLDHGSVVIAAITSCTNTSNPNVMLGAGLLAKKAYEAGLRVKSYIKTSLAPGSGVVKYYLENSNLLTYLEELGFNIVGYGCTTCIGNSGPLPREVAQAVEAADLVVAGVLSGNRNYEGRIHPQIKANYLCSPPLVVAYALAGTVNINFDVDPVGVVDGRKVYLKDIWVTSEEVEAIVSQNVLADLFQKVYSQRNLGNAAWNELETTDNMLYPWSSSSTYIHQPPYFINMSKNPNPVLKIENAYALLLLGDSITTDHISPAGTISVNSPAAKYLMDRGVKKEDFNSYGSRRGNDEVMIRGTFANIRLVNKMVDKAGPFAIHVPTREVGSVFDVSEKYKKDNIPLIIIAGHQYGSGSSRDWAAKGSNLLHVKAVIAQSYERIHRSNLVQFGVLPMQFKEGENSDTYQLTGNETFSFDLGDLSKIKIRPTITVTAKRQDQTVKKFDVIVRFDTLSELVYYTHGGVLHYVIRNSI